MHFSTKARKHKSEKASGTERVKNDMVVKGLNKILIYQICLF